MSSSLKSTIAEESRLKSYLNQVQQRNESEVRDLQARQADLLQKEIEDQEFRLEQMRKFYEVRISSEAETLEEKLNETRAKSDHVITEEKKKVETEVEKVKTAGQRQIEEYRKQNETQIEKLRKELQASTDNLQGMARKAAKRKESANV